MTCNCNNRFRNTNTNTDSMTWEEFQEWTKEQQEIQAQKEKEEHEAQLEQELLEKEAELLKEQAEKELEREQFLLDLKQIYLPIAIGVVLTIVVLFVLYIVLKSRFL